MRSNEHAANGRGRALALSLALLSILALAGAGCGGKEEAPQHGQAHASPGARGGKGNGRPAKPAIPVAATPASLGEIASYYHATATLRAEKEAQVLARVSGLVAAIAAEEGDFVRTGGPLLEIGNGEYRLRAEQARARVVNLKARFDRVAALHAEGGISKEEYQAAASDLAVAEAEQGLADLDLSYASVTAPFSGRVTRRFVDVGQNLSAGTPLFVVADFDPLLAEVHVPSREFKALRVEQPVALALDGGGAALSGRIKLISPVIDPASGTIKVTVEIPDYPESTRPGDFAEVRIVTERHVGVVLVPRGAVLTEKGETFVYTVAEGEAGTTAERRVVELGFSDDERAEIAAGLEAGERVVVKGQRSLEHGAALKLLDEAAPGAES